MKILLIIFAILIPMMIYSQPGKTTSSINDGNWGTASNWNNGIPIPNKDIININDSINATTISILTIGSSATLVVKSGAVLVVNDIIFSNGSIIKVEVGGLLIVLGNLTNKNNSINVLINGELSVAGTLENGVGSIISGNGVIIAEDYTGECCIMGFNPDSLPNGTIINDSVIDTELAVELTYFSAGCEGECVEIKWITNSEVNNDFFCIYRSTDLINWVELNHVKGSGNSNKPVEYLAFDCTSDVRLNTIFYKLKQFDYDGKCEEFDLIHVFCEKTHKEITIFPNPLKYGETLFIQGISENEEVLIMDMLGKFYKQNDLPIGVYVVIIDKKTYKLIVD